MGVRWEVGFLVGPCSRDEALALLDELSPIVAGRLSACGAVTVWREDDPGSSSGKTPGFDLGDAGSTPAPGTDLWDQIQRQRAANAKLQRKYDALKGQLRLLLARRCRACHGVGLIPGFFLGTVKKCPACDGRGS